MEVVASFGLGALLLSVIGIYGVVAYSVSLRRRELGVRMALGARASNVWATVVWKGLRPVTFGLIFGIPTALAASHLARSLLFGVTPTDALTLTTVGSTLVAVATLACMLPAYSAGMIDPATVLREE